MKNNLQIVSVVKDKEIFLSFISNNSFMNQYPVYAYDNRYCNMAISYRYNHFIRHFMGNNNWIVFCDQDFSFLEDPIKKLDKLDKNCIYGPIGATLKVKPLSIVLKLGLFKIRSFAMELNKEKLIYWGNIFQGQDSDNNYQPLGKYLEQPKIVDTIDCCCIIVHSSLINKYNLRFDEKLKWHLFAEEFSLNARYKHNIKIKAVQLSCKHMSPGQLNIQFIESLKYLKEKYKSKKFGGTCFGTLKPNVFNNGLKSNV